jgi:2-keto-4-pentenoate hydratase
MGENKAGEAAKLLMDAWESGSPIPELPKSCTPANEAEAIAINDAIIAANTHEIGGWKIGATGPAPQKALGLSQPFIGFIRAANIDTGATTYNFADLNRPIIESEYAYRLKADLPARDKDYTRSDIEAAIGSLIIGMEVPLSRLGPDHGLGPLALVADHGGTGRFVIGAEYDDWQGIDAINQDVVLTFDGAEAGRGAGEAMLGDPINAVVWFANHMSGKGVGLKAGEFISTGSCTGVIPAPGPTEAVADFGPEGKVELTLK